VESAPSKEEAVDELLAALVDPDAFRALVDALEPGPIVTALRLWGVAHGVYPADPLPASDARELRSWGWSHHASWASSASAQVCQARTARALAGKRG
jgi:hypothetical protein